MGLECANAAAHATLRCRSAAAQPLGDPLGATGRADEVGLGDGDGFVPPPRPGVWTGAPPPEPAPGGRTWWISGPPGDVNGCAGGPDMVSG